jgi:hypothetical protein
MLFIELVYYILIISTLCCIFIVVHAIVQKPKLGNSFKKSDDCSKLEKGFSIMKESDEEYDLVERTFDNFHKRTFNNLHK